MSLISVSLTTFMYLGGGGHGVGNKAPILTWKPLILISGQLNLLSFVSLCKQKCNWNFQHLK